MPHAATSTIHNAGSSSIIYLQDGSIVRPVAPFYQLESTINCRFTYIFTLSDLTYSFESYKKFKENDVKFAIILVNLPNKEINGCTIADVVNMITVIHKHTCSGYIIKIGVVIDDSCDITDIRELKKTDVLGIIPNPDSFGISEAQYAMQDLLMGRPHWPKNILDTLSRPKIIKDTNRGGIRLTPRQQEVLSLVCKRGLSNKKIASVLSISESTVKIHVSAILKEYGVRNRTQLALAATSSLKV